MKSIQSFFLQAALVTCAASAAFGADVKVIANSSVSVSSLSMDELKRVFLLTKSTLEDGSRVEPVIAKGPVHEAFLKEYIGKTDSALQTFYRSLVFTGKGTMPKSLASDDDVTAYVAKTKGAIGYISAGATAAGVKTIEVK
jgi:hypothetical protein